MPPAYTVEPDTANAVTMLVAFGFQPVAAPVASSAAMRFRVSPPIELKVPPAYTVEPDTANA